MKLPDNKISCHRFRRFRRKKDEINLRKSVQSASSAFQFYLLIIILFWQISSNAQTIHFSQLFSTATLVNPANTGNFSGNWRVNNTYREQGNNFNAPYKTDLIGFDKHFYVQGNQISAGILFVNDNSAQNTLTANKLYFACTYHINISEKSVLRFGIQAGIVEKSNTNKNLALPEQFDMSTGQFNSSLPNSENLTNEQFYYMDLAGGIIWKYKFSDLETEFGGAAFQLNKPNEKFMNVNSDIPVKTVFHGSIKKHIGSNIYLKPQTYYVKVKKSSELLFGTNIGYEFTHFSKISDIYMVLFVRGGFERNTDAAIIGAGFSHNNWNLCFSYDYDISGLHLNTSRSNAFEISVTFIKPETFVKQKTEPCSIY